MNENLEDQLERSIVEEKPKSKPQFALTSLPPKEKQVQKPQSNLSGLLYMAERLLSNLLSSPNLGGIVEQGMKAYNNAVGGVQDVRLERAARVIDMRDRMMDNEMAIQMIQSYRKLGYSKEQTKVAMREYYGAKENDGNQAQ